MADLKTLVENKIENGELKASEVVATLLLYVTEENILEMIENRDLDITMKEVMDFREEFSQDEFILVKDHDDIRVEVRKNANGYHFTLMTYDENNIPDEEIFDSARSYEYFDTVTEAWEAGAAKVEDLR